MREASAISMVLGGLKAFTGHLYLFLLGLWLGSHMLLHLVIEFGPLGILCAVNFRKLGALLGV
jgi:hypothetical protein